MEQRLRNLRAFSGAFGADGGSFWWEIAESGETSGRGRMFTKKSRPSRKLRTVLMNRDAQAAAINVALRRRGSTLVPQYSD